jgi:hypothetical protein
MSETAGGCVYDGVPLHGVRLRLLTDGRIVIGGATLLEVSRSPGRYGCEGVPAEHHRRRPEWLGG